MGMEVIKKKEEEQKKKAKKKVAEGRRQLLATVEPIRCLLQRDPLQWLPTVFFSSLQQYKKNRIIHSPSRKSGTRLRQT